MSETYQDINYRLRPGKCIERKMLSEAFRRLSAFSQLPNYQYVGFGSTFFSDFVLFHKVLGLKKMLSIEEDKRNKERFEFNKPFNCVDVVFDHSSDVLPLLKWKDRTILWLDYDKRLSGFMLGDVKQFCLSAKSGSVIVVSANAMPGHADEDRLNGLLTRGVAKDRIPIGTRHTTMGGWGTARVYREILHAHIEEAITDRSRGLPAGERLNYAQLFNFQYDDGAKMVTVGGVIYSNDEKDRFDRCEFFDDELPFIRQGPEAYRIEVPNLTLRELRHLDAHLPAAKSKLPKISGIKERDIQRYAKLYRYFPAFVEAEL